MVFSMQNNILKIHKMTSDIMGEIWLNTFPLDPPKKRIIGIPIKSLLKVMDGRSLENHF